MKQSFSNCPGCPYCWVHPRPAEGQPDESLVEGNVASQLTRLFYPLDYFMCRCEVEREANKQPHNTLASLKAKISEVMTNIDREMVILSCQWFWSQIEAIVEASGDLI